MGYALAAVAAELGARVTLVSGPTDLATPSGVSLVGIETTRQMYDAVRRRFARTDCLIMAAAPADFAPAREAAEKIKKSKSASRLDLRPTVDILAEMGRRKKRQLLVGFALETENGIANARKKLKAKNLDLIVLNSPRDPGSAFEHDTNKVTLLRPGRKPEPWPQMTKMSAAAKLLEKIARML
jgi:phosphopantothenoylcysteine decarboxylase/phosphopantothenate--cysteine ligase